MTAVLPELILLSDQAQPGFMDERSRLERMAGGFTGHFMRGQFAQFLVNQRQ